MWITVTDTEGVEWDVNFSLVATITSMGDKSFLRCGFGTITIYDTEHDRIRKILGIKDEQ